MSAAGDAFEAPLSRAAKHVRAWLDELPTRQVTAAATAEQVRAALGDRLPDGPADPAEVVDLLATAATPGLVATPSGRFYGFVIGGTLPAALAADWLVSAWDQNYGLRAVSPASSAIEDIAAGWLLDLLGLPPRASSVSSVMAGGGAARGVKRRGDGRSPRGRSRRPP